MSRTLEELAAAAVDASQSDVRELTVDPDEYGTLIRQIRLDHNGAVADAWDPIVFRVATERGLLTPLPDVKVIVDFRRRVGR